MNHSESDQNIFLKLNSWEILLYYKTTDQQNLKYLFFLLWPNSWRGFKSYSEAVWQQQLIWNLGENCLKIHTAVITLYFKRAIIVWLCVCVCVSKCMCHAALGHRLAECVKSKAKHWVATATSQGWGHGESKQRKNWVAQVGLNICDYNSLYCKRETKGGGQGQKNDTGKITLNTFLQ